MATKDRRYYKEDWQRDRLEKIFQSNKRPTRRQYNDICRDVGIEDRRIVTKWFKDRRRREKKEMAQAGAAAGDHSEAEASDNELEAAEGLRSLSGLDRSAFQAMKGWGHFSPNLQFTCAEKAARLLGGMDQAYVECTCPECLQRPDIHERAKTLKEFVHHAMPQIPEQTDESIYYKYIFVNLPATGMQVVLPGQGMTVAGMPGNRVPLAQMVLEDYIRHVVMSYPVEANTRVWLFVPQSLNSGGSQWKWFTVTATPSAPPYKHRVRQVGKHPDSTKTVCLPLAIRHFGPDVPVPSCPPQLFPDPRGPLAGLHATPSTHTGFPPTLSSGISEWTAPSMKTEDPTITPAIMPDPGTQVQPNYATAAGMLPHPQAPHNQLLPPGSMDLTNLAALQQAFQQAYPAAAALNAKALAATAGGSGADSLPPTQPLRLDNAATPLTSGAPLLVAPGMPAINPQHLAPTQQMLQAVSQPLPGHIARPSLTPTPQPPQYPYPAAGVPQLPEPFPQMKELIRSRHPTTTETPTPKSAGNSIAPKSPVSTPTPNSLTQPNPALTQPSNALPQPANALSQPTSTLTQPANVLTQSSNTLTQSNNTLQMATNTPPNDALSHAQAAAAAAATAAANSYLNIPTDAQLAEATAASVFHHTTLALQSGQAPVACTQCGQPALMAAWQSGQQLCGVHYAVLQSQLYPGAFVLGVDPSTGVVQLHSPGNYLQDPALGVSAAMQQEQQQQIQQQQMQQQQAQQQLQQQQQMQQQQQQMQQQQQQMQQQQQQQMQQQMQQQHQQMQQQQLQQQMQQQQQQHLPTELPAALQDPAAVTAAASIQPPKLAGAGGMIPQDAEATQSFSTKQVRGPAGELHDTAASDTGAHTPMVPTVNALAATDVASGNAHLAAEMHIDGMAPGSSGVETTQAGNTAAAVTSAAMNDATALAVAVHMSNSIQGSAQSGIPSSLQGTMQNLQGNPQGSPPGNLQASLPGGVACSLSGMPDFSMMSSILGASGLGPNNVAGIPNLPGTPGPSSNSPSFNPSSAPAVTTSTMQNSPPGLPGSTSFPGTDSALQHAVAGPATDPAGPVPGIVTGATPDAAAAATAVGTVDGTPTGAATTEQQSLHVTEPPPTRKRRNDSPNGSTAAAGTMSGTSTLSDVSCGTEQVKKKKRRLESDVSHMDKDTTRMDTDITSRPTAAAGLVAGADAVSATLQLAQQLLPVSQAPLPLNFQSSLLLNSQSHFLPSSQGLFPAHSQASLLSNLQAALPPQHHALFPSNSQALLMPTSQPSVSLCTPFTHISQAPPLLSTQPARAPNLEHSLSLNSSDLQPSFPPTATVQPPGALPQVPVPPCPPNLPPTSLSAAIEQITMSTPFLHPHLMSSAPSSSLTLSDPSSSFPLSHNPPQEPPPLDPSLLQPHMPMPGARPLIYPSGGLPTIPPEQYSSLFAMQGAAKTLPMPPQPFISSQPPVMSPLATGLDPSFTPNSPFNSSHANPFKQPRYQSASLSSGYLPPARAAISSFTHSASADLSTSYDGGAKALSCPYPLSSGADVQGEVGMQGSGVLKQAPPPPTHLKGQESRLLTMARSGTGAKMLPPASRSRTKLLPKLARVDGSRFQTLDVGLAMLSVLHHLYTLVNIQEDELTSKCVLALIKSSGAMKKVKNFYETLLVFNKTGNIKGVERTLREFADESASLKRMASPFLLPYPEAAHTAFLSLNPKPTSTWPLSLLFLHHILIPTTPDPQPTPDAPPIFTLAGSGCPISAWLIAMGWLNNLGQPMRLFVTHALNQSAKRSAASFATLSTNLCNALGAMWMWPDDMNAYAQSIGVQMFLLQPLPVIPLGPRVPEGVAARLLPVLENHMPDEAAHVELALLGWLLCLDICSHASMQIVENLLLMKVPEDGPEWAAELCQKLSQCMSRELLQFAKEWEDFAMYHEEIPVPMSLKKHTAQDLKGDGGQVGEEGSEHGGDRSQRNLPAHARVVGIVADALRALGLEGAALVQELLPVAVLGMSPEFEQQMLVKCGALKVMVDKGSWKGILAVLSRMSRQEGWTLAPGAALQQFLTGKGGQAKPDGQELKHMDSMGFKPCESIVQSAPGVWGVGTKSAVSNDNRMKMSDSSTPPSLHQTEPAAVGTPSAGTETKLMDVDATASEENKSTDTKTGLTKAGIKPEAEEQSWMNPSAISSYTIFPPPDKDLPAQLQSEIQQNAPPSAPGTTQPQPAKEPLRRSPSLNSQVPQVAIPTLQAAFTPHFATCSLSDITNAVLALLSSSSQPAEAYAAAIFKLLTLSSSQLRRVYWLAQQCCLSPSCIVSATTDPAIMLSLMADSLSGLLEVLCMEKRVVRQQLLAEEDKGREGKGMWEVMVDEHGEVIQADDASLLQPWAETEPDERCSKFVEMLNQVLEMSEMTDVILNFMDRAETIQESGEFEVVYTYLMDVVKRHSRLEAQLVVALYMGGSNGGTVGVLDGARLITAGSGPLTGSV